jgi:acyl-CoA hydrolase
MTSPHRRRCAEMDLAAIDLARWMRPGSRVVWTNGFAEPVALVERLVDQRAEIGGVRPFLTISYSSVLAPEHADHLKFDALGGLGTYSRLARAGVLNVIPMHLSQFCSHLSTGRIPVDVAFVQLAGPDSDGRFSAGLNHSFTHDLIERADFVIAEINSSMAFLPGVRLVDPDELDIIVRSDRRVPARPQPIPDEVDHRIADVVHEYVDDGSTLEVGIGSVPSALLGNLHDRSDLGIHTGMLNDPLLELIAAGVVTNRWKTMDAGLSTASTIYPGSFPESSLPDLPLALRPSREVLSPASLAQLPRFVAVNSALQVDLSGQVNAERAGDRQIGAVGGLVDFARGARLSTGGCSIIALRSRTSRGESRIVARLAGGVVTLARSDVDLVVTEWGSAWLADASLADRARRLIAIAHPDDREALEAAAHRDGSL